MTTASDPTTIPLCPECQQPKPTHAGKALTSQFKAGDLAYLLHGGRCEIVSAIADGFVVREVLEVGDQGETVHGEPIIVDAVFAAAPVAQIDAEYAKQAAELEAIRAEVHKERLAGIALRREQEELTKWAKTHEAVANLFSLLNKTATHAVVSKWYGVIAVYSLAEACGQYPEYNVHCRGYGDVSFNLRIDGESYKCVLAGSLEEAKAIAVAQIAAAFDKYRQQPPANRTVESGLVKSAAALGVAIPADIQSEIDGRARRELLAKQAEIARQAADVAAQLNALPEAAKAGGAA